LRHQPRYSSLLIVAISLAIAGYIAIIIAFQQQQLLDSGGRLGRKIIPLGPGSGAQVGYKGGWSKALVWT
jgi:hypothetical protein